MMHPEAPQASGAPAAGAEGPQVGVELHSGQFKPGGEGPEG